MNKIGILYGYWCTEWDVDCMPYLEKVKQLGFDTLEINTLRLTKMSVAEIEHFMGRAKDLQIDVLGYWRKKKSSTQVPLQDFFQAQVAHNEEVIPRVASDALQDLFSMQPAVVVGLNSMMTGSALQEDIASTVQMLVRKGRDILVMNPGSETTRPTDENQTTSLSATTANCAPSV